MTTIQIHIKSLAYGFAMASVIMTGLWQYDERLEKLEGSKEIIKIVEKHLKENPCIPTKPRSYTIGKNEWGIQLVSVCS